MLRSSEGIHWGSLIVNSEPPGLAVSGAEIWSLTSVLLSTALVLA